ncbi:hypothetical protein HK405_007235 [Cladochytrium tenue]|nr:hypothetical protein HK405_007235 [Cladochytrium tenue]
MHLSVAAAAVAAALVLGAAGDTAAAAAIPSGSAATTRCGASWAQANQLCGTACPSGLDAECPAGQYCYADLDVTPCTGDSASSTGTGSTDGPSSTSSDTTDSSSDSSSISTSTAPASTTAVSNPGFRCGASWLEANSACGVSCPNGVDSDCPSGQFCYADLDLSPWYVLRFGLRSCSLPILNVAYSSSSGPTATLSSGSVSAPASTTTGQASSLRCGSSWQDANSACGVSCPNGVDSDCPSGEFCYASLDLTPCTSGSTVSVLSTQRCGATWADANGSCGSSCPNGDDSDCPEGQHCYGDLDVSACSPKMIHPQGSAETQAHFDRDIRDVHLLYDYSAFDVATGVPQKWRYEMWFAGEDRIVYAIHGGPMAGRLNYQKAEYQCIRPGELWQCNWLEGKE